MTQRQPRPKPPGLKSPMPQGPASGPITVRPGRVFGRYLADFGDEWGLSPAESLRRLGILAAFGLDERLYGPLHELHAAAVEKFGRRHESFMTIVAQVYARFEYVMGGDDEQELTLNSKRKVIEATARAFKRGSQSAVALPFPN